MEGLLVGPLAWMVDGVGIGQGVVHRNGGRATHEWKN